MLRGKNNTRSKGKLMRHLIICSILAVTVALGCATKADPRRNRAVQFATWAEPKANCQALTTAPVSDGVDTALCEIKGINHWCAAPAASAPSCTPYGAPPAPTPAPVENAGSGSAAKASK